MSWDAGSHVLCPSEMAKYQLALLLTLTSSANPPIVFISIQLLNINFNFYGSRGPLRQKYLGPTKALIQFGRRHPQFAKLLWKFRVESQGTANSFLNPRLILPPTGSRDISKEINAQPRLHNSHLTRCSEIVPNHFILTIPWGKPYSTSR